MIKVTVVGCGEMGRYHLQSLLSLECDLLIQVVEPNQDSIASAKKIVGDLLEGRKNSRIEWKRTLDELKSKSDLTIVATLADVRPNILKKLISMGHKRFLVEKMVSQKIEDYKRLMEITHQNRVKMWVNCTRRYSVMYKKIKDILYRGTFPIVFNVVAGNLGLGANAVHYLDLFCWFSNDDSSIKLKSNYLLPTLFPNKRGRNLVEFAGTIVGKTQREDFVSLNFLFKKEAVAMVNIFNEDTRILVDEISKKSFIANRNYNWKWEERPFEIPYTSKLTAKIAEEIVEKDNCELPMLDDLYYIHRELFTIFNSAIGKVTGEKVKKCPIT